ncbi:hypothetical protein ABK040_006131 [Willaertia magna]
MEEANSKLLEELQEKDSLIDKLRGEIEKLRSENISEVGSDDLDLKDKKILDLAKKNKALTVQLHKEKSKVNSLTEQLSKLSTPSTENNLNAKHFSSKSKDNKVEPASDDSSVVEEHERQIKEYKEKLEKSEKRSKMLREQNEKYKSENLKLRTVIQKEVGEDVVIDNLLNSTEGFRGRAQQIYLLKNKVKDLMKKLETVSTLNAGNSSPSLNSENVSKVNIDASYVTQSVGSDEKQKKLLEKIEQERKEELSNLKKQITEKTDEIKEMKLKYEASISRNKILEKSVYEVRTKLNKLLEKSENDSRYITALKGELDNAKKKRSDSARSGRQPLTQGNFYQLEQENIKLKEDLEMKEEIIKALKTELQLSSKKILDTMQLRSSESFSRMSQENEEELKLKLTIAEIEVEKLRELRTLLFSKMSEVELKLKEAGDVLLQERQRNAELERKNQLLRREEKPQIIDNIDYQQLLDQIDILKDENNALKLTLESSKNKKDEELQIFQELIDSQKKKYEQYLSALKEQMKQSGISEEDIPTLSQSIRGVASKQEKKENVETKDDIVLLLEENNMLKKELNEIKLRYNSLAMQNRNSKRE